MAMIRLDKVKLSGIACYRITFTNICYQQILMFWNSYWSRKIAYVMHLKFLVKMVIWSCSQSIFPWLFHLCFSICASWTNRSLFFWPHCGCDSIKRKIGLNHFHHKILVLYLFLQVKEMKLEPTLKHVDTRA